MSAAALSGRYHGAAPRPATRAALVGLIVAGHALLFLLLLAARVPVARPDRPSLALFDIAVPPPPPPETRPPPPPERIAPRPARRLGAQPGGSSGTRAASPAPLAAGAAADQDATMAPAAPSRPPPVGIGSAADLAGPGASGATGAAEGDGSGAGSGLGDGVGRGSGADGGIAWRRAEWIVKPDDGMIGRAWPRRALRDRRAGQVLLACIVPRPGRPKHCRVVHEDPAGYGFGQAALALYPDFRIRPVSSTKGDHPDVPVLVAVVFESGANVPPH